MANVATATQKANVNDSIQGGWVSYHQFTFDPASVAAAVQAALTVGVAGVKTGDLVFINAEGLPTGLVCAGAKVTGADTVTIYLNNTIDATTAVDAPSTTFDLLVLHKS